MTFIKGQSGNPAGRPKKEDSITSLLKDKLFEQQEGETRAQKLTNLILMLAFGYKTKEKITNKFGVEIEKEVVVSPDKDMIKLIMMYVDGPPIQRIDHDPENKGILAPLIYIPANGRENTSD